MKVFALLSVLLASSSAIAGQVGFFNIQKAITSSVDAKKADEEMEADLKSKNEEIKKADDSAKAAEAKCAKSPASCVDARQQREQVEELAQRYRQQLGQKKNGVEKTLSARVDRILPAVRKAKHLDALVGFAGATDIAPALDFTKEITARLDAGEGKGDAEKLAEAEKRAADAEAKAAKSEERAKAAEAKLASNNKTSDHE